MNPKTRQERLVIVGGCAAGMSAASKAKRMNPTLEVIALEKTPHVSYSACGIPYYVADLVREPEELVSITPEEFRKKRGIEVFTGYEVTEINPSRKEISAVEVTSGRERLYQYDKSVIAVGGIPNRLSMQPKFSQNVFTIQTLQDGIRLRKYVDEQRPKRAVIVGGGYIAMEMAEALRTRNLEVIIVELRKRILNRYEKEISDIVRQVLQKRGVEVLESIQVESLDMGSLGKVQSVVLNNQENRPADLVLCCMGLRPNTRLAESAGVQVGNTGAIKVDWKLQTSVANIYAAGDCVEVKNLVSGKPDYIPLGPTANKQGRIAGENIGGGTAMFRGVVGTSVFKTFELEVATTGLNCAEARQAGFDADSVSIQEKSRAGYYPNVVEITICVIFDKRSGRLLGAQMVGEEGVSKRIDVFATALTNRMTLKQAAQLDLSYAPPFAPVWDPVLVALNVAANRFSLI